jgi:hypothetical protein
VIRKTPLSIAAVIAVMTVTAIFGPLRGHAAHQLAVPDISGYYVTDDTKAAQRTLMLRLVDKGLYQGLEQANFAGKFGSIPIVGQGIIAGDEDHTENFIRFNFLQTNTVGETTLTYCMSRSRGGVVVGIDVGTSDGDVTDPKTPKVAYRRVTKARYLAVYARTDGRS